ncbi:MBL fold metallo-hydrolase [Paenibacillus daejeonensis]|uniref:MBL fold metallo-hydrolase n=1 Tax=Paenibacillus daejeonensis TaxID=135193 RepID=UPI0003761A15|nr:MBL fold metallo-hydrolase [Paenibacillus daejeonensis]
MNETIIPVYGSSYMYAGKCSVGLYLDKTTKTAILMDSGPDERTAEEIDHALSQEGFSIRAIIHTHTHNSSRGGDAYYALRYPEIRIYATPSSLGRGHGFEHGLRNVTITELGENLRQELLDVLRLLNERDEEVQIAGVNFRILPLPGHDPGMVGIMTPDQVLYCGDALFGERILRKQTILLYTHFGAARRSFRKLAAMRPKAYVLYHGGIYRDLSQLINQHLERFNRLVLQTEQQLAEQSVTVEQLVHKLMQNHALEDGIEQYWLVTEIVHACINELLELDRVTVSIHQGTLRIGLREHLTDRSG